MAGEGDQDLWLGPTLRQWPTAPADPCVDAETLAAWSEGKLDEKRAAVVELHASNCPRCMTLLASIERTTPAPEEPAPSWSRGALLRWLVPLTAAATAVAIWIAVPDRPVTQTQPAPAVQEAPRTDESRQLGKEAAPVPPTPAPEAAKPDQFAPSEPAGRSVAVDAQRPAGARENAQGREEMKSERQELDSLREQSLATLRDRAAAPPPSSAAGATPSAPAVAMPSAPATLNETVAVQPFQQSLAAAVPPSSESTSPADPLIRWRVVGWAAVERSIDGGSTWIKTTQPPGVTADSIPMLWIVSVRAVDNMRGTILTSDRRELYTTNGGLTWERVQENSVAPF
jgi:hypothetical protein